MLKRIGTAHAGHGKYQPTPRVMGIPNPLLDLIGITPLHPGAKEKLRDKSFMRSLGFRLGEKYARIMSGAGLYAPGGEKLEAARVMQSFVSLDEDVSSLESSQSAKQIPKETAESIYRVLNSICMLAMIYQNESADMQTAREIVSLLHGGLLATGKLPDLFNSGLRGYKITGEGLRAIVIQGKGSFTYLKEIRSISLSHCRSKYPLPETVCLLGQCAADISYLHDLFCLK